MRYILKRLSCRHGSTVACLRLAAFALVAVASAFAPAAAQAAFGPLGQDVRISFMGPDGSTSFQASQASVAYNPSANEYLVVWVGDDNTLPLVDNEREIFAQRVSATGASLGGRIRVSDMGPDGSGIYDAALPSVAYNPAANEYLVAWQGEDNTAMLVDGEYEIFGQRLSAAGAAVGANDFRISDMGPNGNTTYEASHPTVAYSSAANEYLVTWQGDDNTAPLVDGEEEIFALKGAEDWRVQCLLDWLSQAEQQCVGKIDHIGRRLVFDPVYELEDLLALKTVFTFQHGNSHLAEHLWIRRDRSS